MTSSGEAAPADVEELWPTATSGVEELESATKIQDAESDVEELEELEGNDAASGRGNKARFLSIDSSSEY